MGGGGLRKPDFGEFWRPGALGGRPGTGSDSRKTRRVREGVKVFVEVRHGLGVARRRRRRRARARFRRRQPPFFTLARSGGPEGEHRAGWRTSPWSRGEAGCPRRSVSPRTSWTGPPCPRPRRIRGRGGGRGAGAGAAGARQRINGSGLRPLGEDDGQPGDDHRQSYFGDDRPNSQSQLERTIGRLSSS